MTMDLSSVNWAQIQAVVHRIEDDPTTTRVDLKFGNTTVLAYRAGTVIRIDFKEVS